MVQVVFEDCMFAGLVNGVSQKGFEYYKINFIDGNGDYYQLFVDKPDFLIDDSVRGQKCDLTFDISPSYRSGVRFSLVDIK